MAILTHSNKYPCAFDLRLLEQERYGSKSEDSDIKTAPLGEPYTLWVQYRMALRIDEHVLYQSAKDTTLVFEDISRLIEELQQLASGTKDKMAFNPIEPGFELVIRCLTESNASVAAASAAKIRAEALTNAISQSPATPNLFDVGMWIDHANQVDRIYGGYGPGLYFFVEALDVERFASQVVAELNGLGPYFASEREK